MTIDNYLSIITIVMMVIAIVSDWTTEMQRERIKKGISHFFGEQFPKILMLILYASYFIVPASFIFQVLILETVPKWSEIVVLILVLLFYSFEIFKFTVISRKDKQIEELSNRLDLLEKKFTDPNQ